MKIEFLFAVGFWVAVSGFVNVQAAQDQALELPQASMEAQRAKISEQRAKLHANFLQEDVACYDKFAVNHCLEKINTKRNQAMADLRRQEILLNDEERKNKGAAQIQKIQEKSSPENQQEAAQQRAKVAEDYQLRLAHEKARQQARNVTVSGEKTSRDAYTKKLIEHQKKDQARVQKKSVAAEKVQKFNVRKKEAEEHEARHQADQLKRTSPVAKPLPLPELSR